MVMSKAKATDSIPQSVHNDLAAEGIDSSAWIDWVLAHGCDVAQAVKALVPLLPLSDRAKFALLSLLNTLCP